MLELGGNPRFWFLFGGIWLVVGIGFIGTSLGVNPFAEANAANSELPLWVFALVGVVAAAAGAAIVYFARNEALRDRRLADTGVELTAAVVDVRRSAVDINRQSRWHVVYRYEHPAGRSHDGESRAMSGGGVDGYKPGDKVRIKVDPGNPAESLFIG